MAEFIFRRIKGRIIPIKLSGKKAHGSTAEYTVRKIRAQARIDGFNKPAAHLMIKSPKVGKVATAGLTKINRGFNQQGLHKELLRYAAKLMKRAGKVLK